MMHAIVATNGNNQLTMSSREIAELVNSRHDSVKRTIERAVERSAIGDPPLVETEEINNLGLPCKIKEYIFTGEQGRRDSIVVVAQLSPEFTGRLVDRWQELEKAIATKSTSLTDYDKAIIGNMVKQEIESLVPILIEPMLKAKLLERHLLIRYGKTAGEIWRMNNLPRLKNAAQWLGNRLSEMGCAIEDNGRAECGTYSVRLFDPDKANICLKNGLLHTAKLYASERQGQGKLRLVSPHI